VFERAGSYEFVGMVPVARFLALEAMPVSFARQQ